MHVTARRTVASDTPPFFLRTAFALTSRKVELNEPFHFPQHQRRWWFPVLDHSPASTTNYYNDGSASKAKVIPDTIDDTPKTCAENLVLHDEDGGVKIKNESEAESQHLEFL